MATASVQRVVPIASVMPRHVSFKGDQDSHLTGLIVASQKKHVEDAALKERTLVPFFDSALESSVLEPLEARSKHKKVTHDQHASTRPRRGNAKHSPTSSHMSEDAGHAKQNSRKGKGKAASTKQQNAGEPHHQGRKHNRDPSYRHLPGLAPTPQVSGRQSPPRKRQEQLYDSASSYPADFYHAAPAKFAGPAFTNSPMPDALPIPSFMI